MSKSHFKHGGSSLLRKTTITLLVLGTLIGAGLFYLHANLDTIIKNAIEKYGSLATQTDVRVDHVKIALADGKGTISGLRVGNPSGFSSTPALYLGEISVQIDIKSLAGNAPILINKIEIIKPQVSYEMGLNGTNNLGQLGANAKAFAASKEGAQNQDNASPSASSVTPSRKMIIHDLILRDSQASVQLANVQQKPISAQIGTIHITNIGRENGGATPAQIANVVMGALAMTAGQAGEKLLLQKTEEIKEKVIEKATDKLMGLLGK